MMEVEFADTRAKARSDEMTRMPVFDDEARCDEHFSQALFAEVFRDEILFAVPSAESPGGVFRKKAIHGDRQFSAWFQDAKAFVKSGLRAAKMFEATDADDAIERFV